LKVCKDFLRHSKFYCSTHKEETGCLVEAVPDSIECALGRFPVFVRTGRINAPFQFATGKIAIWVFQDNTCAPSVAQQDHINVLLDKSRRLVKEACSFWPFDRLDFSVLGHLDLWFRAPCSYGGSNGICETSRGDCPNHVSHHSTKGVASCQKKTRHNFFAPLLARCSLDLREDIQ